MKIFHQTINFLLISALIALAGCAKKPVRPDPRSTMLGPTGGGVNPEQVSTADQNSALTERGNGVIEDADTIRGLLQPVYFDYDHSNIKKSEVDKLIAANKYLKDNPDKRLLLEGHCDWRGTAEYNLGLGDRRAASSKNYLMKTLGVDAAKLETLSKGSQGAVEKGTEEQMAKDRRVELVVLKK